MARVPLASLAALCLAVPAVTRAQTSLLEPPTGTFVGPARTWALSGCADNAVIGLGPDGIAPLLGRAFCVDGRATLGARSGGGYQLLFAFAQTSPAPVVAAGNRYNFLPQISGATFALGADCSALPSPCGGSAMFVGSGPFYHPEYFHGGYDTLEGFDFSTFEVQGVDYGTVTHVPSFPQAEADFTSAHLTATLLPEPTAVAFTLGGLAMVGVVARRRR